MRKFAMSGEAMMMVVDDFDPPFPFLEALPCFA